MKTAQLMDSGYGDDRPAPVQAPPRDTVVPILPAATFPAARPAPAQVVAQPVPRSARLLGWMRGHLGDWLLAVVSIGTVLLLWELATRFRLDFYIRFNNIPTPAEVFDKVIEVNRKRRRLVFSQREAQRNSRDARKESLLGELKEGEVRSGVVSGLRDFGAFVDLGGASRSMCCASTTKASALA